MYKYCVNRNAQPTGEHEVHKEWCCRLPEPQNQLYLGYCLNALDALKKARNFFYDVDGCYYCCSEAHRK